MNNKTLKIIGIIPARYGSTRFPGKPLVNICGKAMIERVYNTAKKSVLLSDVIVATDDQRIADYCEKYDIKYQMTSSTHETGTDRIWEVVQNLDCDIVVNIQGDEPMLKPYMIDTMLRDMIDLDCSISTIALMLRKKYEFMKNPNMVKVLTNNDGFATGFYRQISVFYQNNQMNYPKKHIGIYAYTKEVLKEFVYMPQTVNEVENELEQLRFMDNSYDIHVSIFDEYIISVDVPDDVEKIIKLFLTGDIQWHN